MVMSLNNDGNRRRPSWIRNSGCLLCILLYTDTFVILILAIKYILYVIHVYNVSVKFIVSRDILGGCIRY